jgi:hypothetical protein
MSKKIINIVIFVVAIVACAAALYFAVAFDDTKKDKYYEVGELKANNPQMLIDLAATTPEKLPGFIEKYQQEAAKLNVDMKEQELQRNVEYTFIRNLSDLQNEAAFTDFKAKFDTYAKGLLAKSKRADFFINGFKKVNKFEDLADYVATLEKDYAPVKQACIVHKEYVKAFNGFLVGVDNINTSPSVSRKTSDLATLQENVALFKTLGSTLNFSVILDYIIFFITIAAMLIFALIQIAMNIKNSYKALLGVLFIVLLLIVGYFTSSGELSTSAIKMQHTAGEMKWIGAGAFTFYIVLLLSLTAIVVSTIINAIKNR